MVAKRRFSELQLEESVLFLALWLAENRRIATASSVAVHDCP
jgi:hypothetical protein